MIRKTWRNKENSTDKGRRIETMAEKELRRLKRRELLQMLLVQCEETERLSQEADEIKQQIDAVMESYERLKKKLDVKDERLNQKDEKIAKLKREIEEMKAQREREMEEAGLITGATQRLNAIFEEAQRAAEQYLSSVRKIENRQNPFDSRRPAGILGKQSVSRSGRVVTMKPEKTPAGFERNKISAETQESAYRAAAAVSGDL